LSAHVLLLQTKVEIILSKKAKKADGLEQHKKIQREKEQKRKERKQVALPSKHTKGKK
jgi:hypothetical protein